MITQNKLKRLLHYNQDTGIFTRKVATCNTVKVGDIAGHKRMDGYVVISLGNNSYFAHRLAVLYMENKLYPHHVDHINGIKDDNRWCNLREATSSQNAANTGVRKDNTSGFRGVSWDEKRKKWKTRINVDGKEIHLGRYKFLIQAANAYVLASIKYYGEFAR